LEYRAPLVLAAESICTQSDRKNFQPFVFLQKNEFHVKIAKRSYCDGFCLWLWESKKGLSV